MHTAWDAPVPPRRAHVTGANTTQQSCACIHPKAVSQLRTHRLLHAHADPQPEMICFSFAKEMIHTAK